MRNWTMRAAAADKNTAKANKALVKMFKQYPPTPGTR